MLQVILFFIFFTSSLILTGLFLYFFFVSKLRRKYNIESIVWPFNKKYTNLENIGELIVSPFSLFLGLVSIIILVFIVLINSMFVQGSSGLFGFFLAGFAAYTFSILYLFMIYYADYKEREPPHFIIQLFVWGIIASLFSLFTLFLLDYLFKDIFSPELIFFVSAITMAPVVEEFFKSLGVTLVVMTPEVDDIVDGIVYGSCVGLGFAFIENWLYFTSQSIADPSIWLDYILLRAFTSTLGHMIFTGTTGAVLTWAKFKFKHWYLFFVLFMVLGIVLHSVFNFSTSVFDGILAVLGLPLPIFVFIFIFFGLSIFLTFYIFSVLSEKRKYRKKEITNVNKINKKKNVGRKEKVIKKEKVLKKKNVIKKKKVIKKKNVDTIVKKQHTQQKRKSK